MQHSMRWLACLFLASALAACGGEDDDNDGDNNDDLPQVDCSGDIPAFDEVTAFSEVCTNCHSTGLSGTERNGAPANINWDDYDSAQVHAEDGAEEVFDNDMPPPGSGHTLTNAQKEQLYRWALCGTPQ